MTTSAKYTLLPDGDDGDRRAAVPDTPYSDSPSDDEHGADADDEGTNDERERTVLEIDEESGEVQDPRFAQPAPSPWKRVLLLLAIAFCFWLAYQLNRAPGPPKVIYANRYSKEHKYRPAASPIITETLKDGRLRVRGAAPTSSVTPTPTPTPAKKVKYGKKKKGTGKKKRSTGMKGKMAKK
ncbi:Casein kinase I isoform alpha [Mycena sanguinolenta]|uniref:Casein kinase I isoform alpha n=1 Tax=Mycena sanguinolenta TaxID=230812 RepID=A0A8H6U091_9AGAR|nr:Casein kinase I isoform alpha [Mycena sanguinolenta]